jgi:P4 family phage/plasmid primase-like protien
VIQILALREFFSTKQKKNVKAEVWFERGMRAPTVEAVLADPIRFIEDKTEPSERWNLYYTVSECLEEKGRKLSIQHHIPFDIDKLGLEEMDEVPATHLEAVARVACDAIGVPYDKVGVVFSGNGVQILVGTTHPITDVGYFDKARIHYKAISDRINLRLIAAGLQGQTDVSVWSPARLMRLPMTVNKKPDKPERKARTLQSNMERLDFKLEVASGLPDVKAADHINDKALRDLITPDVPAILNPETGCKFLHWVQTKPAEVSEPQWYAAVSVTARFPEGRKFTHKMSEGHPGYNYEETEQKIEQALQRSGPRTCKNVSEISDKCKTCIHFGTKLVSPILIESPDHIKTEKSGFYHVYEDNNGKIKIGKPDFEGLWKFFSRKHCYVSVRGVQTVYTFNGKFWEEFHRDDILRFAQDHFNPKPTSQMREEFYKYVKVHNLVNVDWFNKSIEGLMNFQNGVYEIKHDLLHEHSKEFGFRSVLPCEYNPKAVAPRFTQFMSEVTCDRQDLVEVVQEFMGYIFANSDCKYQKLMILSGEGENGKSTFVKLLRALAGRDGQSNLSVKDMQNDQNRYLLEGKLVNIAEENSRDSFRDTELIKNFASGGHIRVKKLYSQPYEFENRCKLVMLCNTPPANTDQTHGFYRRLLIIPFDARFTSETRDREIDAKLAAELSGIFNFAVEGYKRLAKQREFTESVTSQESLEGYQLLNDPILDWLADRLVITVDDNQHIPMQELYDDYVSFCAATGVKYPLVRQLFGRRLKALIEKKINRYKQERVGKDNIRHIFNVMFRPKF